MRDEENAAEVRLNRLLESILETASRVLGFDAATLTTRHSGDELGTIAATDSPLAALDDAQYAAREGPCLSVLDPGDPVYLENAAEADDRWEHFSRTAANMGVHTTLSVHIPTDLDEVAASLNFYATRRLELADGQIGVAESFARQLAAAIQSVDAYRSTAKLARDMAEAMRSRSVIEQAKGIIMVDEKIDAEQGFERLSQLSQQANMKLRDLAVRLVAERTKTADSG
ncbi:MAG: GAF and ANTAR domain-containing protein [Mycobacteriales bacterium]